MSSSTPDPAATILAYDRGGAAYAEHSRNRDHLARLREPFMALLPEHPLVLDVGAGPGHDAALMAAHGASVVALDPAEGLLRQARHHEAIGSRLIAGEARHLPFADACFDGVWSCAALLHVPHNEASLAIAEIQRILKPGGFVFLSMSEGNPSEPVLDTSLGLDGRWYYYHHAEDWGALLQEHGFQLILHHANHDSGNFNVGSTGWIETYARKR